MKTLIIGTGTLILSIFVFLCIHDVKTYQRYDFDLRFACEELSVTGTLYNDKVQFSEGYMIFDQVAAMNAIRAQLKSLLKTDDSLQPLHNSYWRDTIQLNVYFIDLSTIPSFPYLFVDPDTGYTETFTNPGVVVTINAGKGRFYFPEIVSPGGTIRSAAHEWKAY